MSRKDEILDDIIATQTRLTENRLEWKDRTEAHKGLTKDKEVLEKAYEEIKKKLDSVAREWYTCRDNLKALESTGKKDSQHLDELKRELSRILDSEKIHKALIAQRDGFREACLGALWRPESRSDGLGALEHQIEGGIHLAVTQKAILGDERGLGKTLTSLIFCDILDNKKVIVVCPSDTMHNFAREILLWTPHRTPVIIGKMPKAERQFLLTALKKADQFTVIVNYEAWRRDSTILQDLKDLKANTLLIDESHNIMNSTTSAAEGVTQLCFANNYCSDCENCRIVSEQGNICKCLCGRTAPKWEFSTIKYVVPISGTTILNKPQELFSQIHLVDPENFPDSRVFLQDFCRKDWNGKWTWQPEGVQRLTKTIGSRLLIRKKADAGITTPPPKPVEHLITTEEFKADYYNQWKAYEQCRKYGQMVLDPDRELAMSIPYKITVLLRLRQVLVWPSAIELKWINPDTKLEEILGRLEVYQSAKVDRAEKLIKEIVEEGNRVVLFSYFKGGLTELQKRLGSRSVIYDGNTAAYQRNQIQLDFDAKTADKNTKWDVVLANYKSGGAGLNLNAANQMILLDSAWNPGTQEQAEGRIDRLGQTKETTIHHIRVEDSIDTWMSQLLVNKKNIIDGFESEVDIYSKAYDALMRGEI